MARGRPKKEIDYALAEKLAQIMCTQEEIANILGVSTKTLQRDEEFCRLYKKGQDTGKMSLKRKQFEVAMKGNTALLIWLGKNYLGQREVPEDFGIAEDSDALMEQAGL